MIAHVWVDTGADGFAQGALAGLGAEGVPSRLPRLVVAHRHWADIGCPFAEAHLER